MKMHRTWHGVRMRQTRVAADPDQAPRLVTLPTAWDDSAVAGLVSLADCASQGRITLVAAAQAWIDPIAERARDRGIDPSLAERLHRLLLLRRGAPGEAVWQRRAADDPTFVLNLPAFVDASGHFDVADFADAVETAVFALTMAAPDARDIAIGLADLAGLLSALGLEYGAAASRDVARALAMILRARADLASAALARTLGARAQPDFDWPAPPLLAV
ncbi:MAG: hypothetical protein AB7S57_15015, partial [Acetobacteraceae bacterium]